MTYVHVYYNNHASNIQEIYSSCVNEIFCPMEISILTVSLTSSAVTSGTNIKIDCGNKLNKYQ